VERKVNTNARVARGPGRRTVDGQVAQDLGDGQLHLRVARGAQQSHQPVDGVPRHQLAPHLLCDDNDK
jgi:hypothetical protein